MRATPNRRRLSRANHAAAAISTDEEVQDRGERADRAQGIDLGRLRDRQDEDDRLPGDDRAEERRSRWTTGETGRIWPISRTTRNGCANRIADERGPGDRRERRLEGVQEGEREERGERAEDGQHRQLQRPAVPQVLHDADDEQDVEAQLEGGGDRIQARARASQSVCERDRAPDIIAASRIRRITPTLQLRPSRCLRGTAGTLPACAEASEPSATRTIPPRPARSRPPRASTCARSAASASPPHATPRPSRRPSPRSPPRPSDSSSPMGGDVEPGPDRKPPSRPRDEDDHARAHRLGRMHAHEPAATSA